MRITILISLLALTLALPAQELELQSSPKGIFIWLKADQPGNYQLEKKSGTGSFQPLVQLQPPANLGTFQSRLHEAEEVFDFLPKIDEPLHEIFFNQQKAVPSASLFPEIQGAAALLIALGYAHIDQEVEKGQTYQYRLLQNGRVLSESSVLAHREEQIPKVKIHPVGYSTNGHYIQLGWGLTGTRDIGGGYLYRSPIYERNFQRVIPEVNVNRIGDTTYLVISDTSLQNVGMYQYWLMATDAVGNPYSITDVMIADNFNRKTVPEVVNLRAEGLSDQRAIKLSWGLRHTARARNLVVFRSRQRNEGYEQVATLVPGDSTYIDQVDIAMEAYHYFVAVRDIMGELVPSIQVFGISEFKEKPREPQRPRGQTIDGGVRLNWRHVAPYVLRYQVLRSEAGENDYSVVGQVRTVDTLRSMEFIDTSYLLSGNTWYSYAIRALSDGFEEGPLSQSVQVRPGKTAILEAPILYQATRDKKGGVMLSWNNLSESYPLLESYSLLRKRTGESRFDTFVASIPANENTFFDRSAPPEEAFEYMVIARDRFSLESPLSNILSVVALERPKQGIPFLTARQSAGGVLLEWPISDDQQMARSVKIFRAQGHQQLRLHKVISASDTHFLDDSIEKGHTYHYMIVLAFQEEESPPSELVTIRN